MKQDFPRIAKEMAGDEPARTGGLPEGPERSLGDTVQESLHTALAAFRGVPEGDQRAQLISMAERLVDEMRQAGPWAPAAFIEPGEGPLEPKWDNGF